MHLTLSPPFQTNFLAGVKYRVSRSLKQDFNAPQLHYGLSSCHRSGLGSSYWFGTRGTSIWQTHNSVVRGFRYGDSCYSGSSYRFGHWSSGHHRGLFFFLGRVVKHYEHLNYDVLKPLKDLHLENVPKNSEFRLTICDDYRFEAKRPTDSYLYDAALLHLKLSNPLVGEILDSLPMRLRAHNGLADSTEADMLTKLTDGLANHKLEYDRTGQAIWNILRLLSDFWRQYMASFKVPPSDRSRLVNYLRRTFPRDDDGHLLHLGVYTVWDEREQGEREKVIDAIEDLVVEPSVIIGLYALEDSKRKLELAIGEIVKEVSKLSKAIDADAYTGKAECCYVLVPRLIRFLVK
jgi:hypothetical protein